MFVLGKHIDFQKISFCPVAQGIKLCKTWVQLKSSTVKSVKYEGSHMSPT